MATIQEVKNKVSRLEMELSTIEAQVIEGRAQLATLASQDPEKAGKIASELMVLEARAQGIKTAIEMADAEGERLEAFVKSKEYKDGLKRIAELELYFAKEADDTYNAVYVLLEHIRQVEEKQKQYTDLIDRVCVDLDPSAKMRKARNRDWLYMLDVFHTLAAHGQKMVNSGIVTNDKKQLTHNPF
jgi:hypothetical protein